MNQPKWQATAVSLALAAATVAVYGRMLRHDWVNYDSAVYVYENPHVRDGLSPEATRWAFDPTHGYAANWHPLTWLSHMVDSQVFGVEKSGGHLAVNLALHVLSTWLLFYVLWRMTRQPTASALPAKRNKPRAVDRQADWSLWQSAFVAAVFALHPLHVESVAWVAERKDVLSGLFWFLTMGAYAWYARQPSWQRMGVVALCLALGLMSKPMLVTLPFVLLLLDAWPLARVRFELGSEALATWRRLIVEKLPLFVLIVVSSVMTYLVQKQGGAVNQSVPFVDRLATGIWAYGMYLFQALWPRNLACFYPRPNGPNTSLIIATCAVALVSITALAVHQRRKRPYLLVGWLWYLGTLVPVIGIVVQVGEQAMADRYTYIPLVGISIMLAWGLPDLLPSGAGRRMLAAASIAAVVAMATVAWRQVGVWKNNESLYRHATEVTANNAFAYTSLGLELRRAGNLDQALTQCQRAVEIDPDDWNNQHNLALVLIDARQLPQALEHARAAVRLSPDQASAHAALGLVMSRSGEHAAAVESYRTAIRLDRSQLKYYLLLARSLEPLERWEQLAATCQQAIQVAPTSAAAWEALGAAQLRLSKLPEAVAALERAAQLAPDDTSYALNAARAQSLLHPEKARAALERILEVDPDLLDALMLAASIDMATGNMQPARAHYRRVLAKSPEHLEATNNLAWLLATEGTSSDVAEAVRLAERTCLATNDKVPEYLDTLALAYGAAGRFDEAKRTATTARQLASDRGDAKLVESLSAALQAYEAGRLPNQRQ